jgi:hypothetical protein
MSRQKKLRSTEGLNWNTYLINGKHYQRVPYGQETHIASEGKVCYCCQTLRGSLHLLGCSQESCSACGRQAISCDCE